MGEQLTDLMSGVTVTSRYGAKTVPTDDWHRTATGYRVTVRYQRRSFTFDYWHGSAITEAPEDRPAEVVDSLLSDAQAGDESFEDFCGNFGYDTDSRKTERTYRACQRTARHVQRVFGGDYERFINAERG
jgi:hypothetical protein